MLGTRALRLGGSLGIGLFVSIFLFCFADFSGDENLLPLCEFFVCFESYHPGGDVNVFGLSAALLDVLGVCLDPNRGLAPAVNRWPTTDILWESPA